QAEQLGRAKRSLIKLDGARGVLATQVGGGSMVAVGNGFHLRAHLVSPFVAAQRFDLYTRTASMTLAVARVGRIRDSSKLAAPNKARNSSSERCRPPVHTSMLTSFDAAPRLAGDWSMRGGYTPSTISSLPRAGIARWQLRRIVVAC